MTLYTYLDRSAGGEVWLFIVEPARSHGTTRESMFKQKFAAIASPCACTCIALLDTQSSQCANPTESTPKHVTCDHRLCVQHAYACLHPIGDQQAAVARAKSLRELEAGAELSDCCGDELCGDLQLDRQRREERGHVEWDVSPACMNDGISGRFVAYCKTCKTTCWICCNPNANTNVAAELQRAAAMYRQEYLSPSLCHPELCILPAAGNRACIVERDSVRNC